MQLLPIVLAIAIAIPVLRAIFLLFRRQPPSLPELTVEEELVSIQEYIPDFYKPTIHFKEAGEHILHSELSLAVKSLMSLANESGHYFSGDFWLNLANCAVAVQMPEEADYCRQKVIDDRREISGETPYGWTTVKIDNTHYQHHIARVISEKWATETRKKDGLSKLLRKNGFYIKAHSRSGTIYYINNNDVLEIGIELSANRRYTWLVYFDHITSWSIPGDKLLTVEEKSVIKIKLIAWLNAKKIKTDINCSIG